MHRNKNISILKKIIKGTAGYDIDENNLDMVTPEILSIEYEKKLGNKYSVYTPKAIVKKMIGITMEKFGEINSEEQISSIKIADISCGTGNFIVAVTEYLINKSIKIFGKPVFYSSWTDGYDIDGEAIKIAVIRMKLLLKKYGIEYKKVEFGLRKTDALALEIDKKYDIIIGNPPYMGEKNNREIFETVKKTEFGKKYYEGKMDYFYFFIEKGLDILKNGGILTYITTNYWLKADYAGILRKKVKSESVFLYAQIIDESVFKDNLGQDNLIFSLRKGKNIDRMSVEDEEGIFFIEEESIYHENNKITFTRPHLTEFFSFLEKKSTMLLGDELNVNQGIVTGYDEAFVFKRYAEEFKEYLKPFYKNKDVRSYGVNEQNEFWILYINKVEKLGAAAEKHLIQYKERLENRREAKNGRIKWYELQWGRNEEIFTQPKIVARQRGVRNLFGYTEKPFYGSADIYYITNKNEKSLFSKEINLFYILGYLNSQVFYTWFFHKGKRKGKDLELYSTPLKETPIFYPDDDDKIKYIESLVKTQINCYNEEIQEKIERFFRGEK